MPHPRNRRHILVPDLPTIEAYTPHPRAIKANPVEPPTNRTAHGYALKQALQNAMIQAQEQRRALGVQVHGTTPGIYVEFKSQPGVSLQLSSLEDRRQGIELCSVTYRKPHISDSNMMECALVFIPMGKVKHFITRFEEYAKTTKKQKGERRHEAMLDPISTLRLATLRSLWTDALEVYPAENEKIWWEIWLRRHDEKELERLFEFADLYSIEIGERRLQFDDRIVILAQATPKELSTSIDLLNDLAELRRAKETAAIFADMDPSEQADWVHDLNQRITWPPREAPAACILDTGVNRGHSLIKEALATEDCHSCNPTWGIHDHAGHGTEMAGLALYGDLTPHLEGSHPIFLRHRLESVKILPSPGAPANRPELYGSITAEATARVEVQAPGRLRCFSLAITTFDQRDQGQPTSWSSAIDALAMGRSFDSNTRGLVYIDDKGNPQQRLFVISSGNVSNFDVAHLIRSDTEAVHDPAQAWNALTVGAYTELAKIQTPSWEGWNPIADTGDLSPWSTTSVPFSKQWPIKPDIVFEGGNIAHDGKNQTDFPCPDLCLLSTYFKESEKAFTLSWATSAAVAQAARMAAIVFAEYPSLWPETVRGLLVHSARWTQAMQNHFHGAGNKKRARELLVRRYGFGVPHLDRTLRSANDSLTLIVQGHIQPFTEGKMREVHFFQLPWPKEVLQNLDSHTTRLRITLSYFIEPNPARRGWTKRYRYASHGLRFEVIGPTESLDDFRKRLNRRALEEDEERPTTGAGSSEWYLGEQARSHGSIHSDILENITAADLAQRGVIGIYPISGWWKDLPTRDRSAIGARYALILSLETDAANVDIWTPVANEVGIPLETTVLI